MNNYIIISKTFCETTPESSEEGDFSKTGFVYEYEEVTFSELVSLMKEHYESSQYPDNGNTNTWYSTNFYTSNYYTGTERQESIHYHIDNTINAAKYWKLAAKIAHKKLYS